MTTTHEPSEITVAEQRLLHMLEASHGNLPTKATDVLQQLSYRHPATVAHAAYWSLIRDQKIVRHDNGCISVARNQTAA